MIGMAPGATEPDIGALVNDFLLDVDDDVFVYVPEESDRLLVYEVYKVKESDPKVVIGMFGEWTTSLGLEIGEKQKWMRRKNFGVGNG